VKEKRIIWIKNRIRDIEKCAEILTDIKGKLSPELSAELKYLQRELIFLTEKPQLAHRG